MSTAYYDQAPEEIRAFFHKYDDDALVYDMLYATGLHEIGCQYMPDYSERIDRARVRLDRERARRIMTRMDRAHPAIRHLFHEFEEAIVIDSLIMAGLNYEEAQRLPDFLQRIADARQLATSAERRSQLDLLQGRADTT